MNLSNSDLNVEQLPPSPGGSSPNGSNNNNENRKLFIYVKVEFITTVVNGSLFL